LLLLYQAERGLLLACKCRINRSGLLTSLTPLRDGWTHSASFQTLGPVVPWPHLYECQRGPISKPMKQKEHVW
jgi:hypothetical protein